ncbi:hypothetical protein DWX05_11155 [Coprobacillus sp. AF18-15LB]|uniref:hypothetical protein n=1 Tax=Faecalibacillus intestinalis TaxID=1982626 RepID=UPI000E4E3814|nr:hypothetical protein [Faecalibacillus intestinalis]RGT59426.1 hypothetical protein DWX19_11595 [Coprobacillus sp. AF18-40]RGT82832.1 hypothetical protein DWX05_11155 [Coprobacillus sp. AF18-15LB]
MENKKENIIDKYLNTKSKKIAAGCVAGVLVIGVAGAVVLNSNGSKNLVLTSNEVDAEFGQKVSTNVADYLDANKVDDIDKIIKDTKEKDNLKYVTVTNKDEQGNVVSKEEKDYPKVGNYTINFTYKKEKQSVKVTVKDTTKPEIEAPESIDVIQYTDLSTFNFGELLKATDYSDVKDWKIDTSKVDVNTIGSYELKVSIQDKYKNKASKKLKVNVVQAPEVGEGEVAVTEVVTDENGNKKTVVTKKSSAEVSKNDAVASTSPVSNKGTVNSSSSASATKPTTNSGTSKPSGNNTSSSNSSNSSSSSKGDEHKHNYNIPITKTVHHDAVTKTVHHDAVTRQETYTVVDKEAYDEPVYETHVVCKVCGQDFGKGEAASDQAGIHSAEFGHSYHSTKVQVGTKHHDAVTHQETKTVTVTPAYDETVIVKQAYDETVITGYKCSCGATK